MIDVIETTAALLPPPVIDYGEEMKQLITSEIDRNERILRRLDECMSAIESSRRILGEH